MTFAGFNVTFGLIQTSSQQPVTPAPIYGPSESSQTMAAATTSSVAATGGPNPSYVPMASFYSSADAWVTIGPNPADPSVDQPIGGRRIIPAQTLIDVFCSVGDKVRWALA